ncbi:MAG: spherulation-specific family 4 protein [Nitrososphaera sp.]|uniref:spherulation-specific family 4 protein n=1 Tax=Nitrososphaera sp. TaxID=1971748 RepID=UPI003D6FFBC5
MRYLWIAIAILILVPIGIFLSVGNDYASPAAEAPIANITAQNPARTGIYFPLFAPPGPLWDNMLVYRHAHPTLPWVAIVDPHHGPGGQYDANYARNIEKLQAANVTVLGYVSTLWAGKSPDLVREDIKKYKDWYGVDGIMLDEMISDPGFEGLYSNYTNYAKSLGMRQVIGNVGTNISPSYVGTVDSISTVEGDRTPPLSWLRGWQLNYDKSNFLYITYSQSWTDPQYIAESTKYVGSLYMTDDTMPFPYDDFPAYFDEVVAVLDPQGDNDLRTLSVRASDLRGNGLEGTLATVSYPAEGTLSTLSTPLARIGGANSTYMVTALSNSTHTFDHWDDGSTNPARPVVLDSSKVLRAYYKTPAPSDLKSDIAVNALTTQGGQLGMWINVSKGEADSGSGLTPLVVSGQDGEAYAVTASDHQQLIFDHWENGSTNRTRAISIQHGDNAYLTAYYRVEKDPSLIELNVDAYTLDGTEIRGLWSVITPSNETAIGGLTPLTHVGAPGRTYAVEAQDRDIYAFDHWGDGSTNRTRTVTHDSDATLSAYYATTLVALKINFASLSGEGLGGMDATVTAMDNSTTSQQRATGANMTFAGRFASVYTIKVSDLAGYAFDHWENGSTSRIRNVMLFSDDLEVTAYYRERP